jgi:soluble P-type ATPase
MPADTFGSARRALSKLPVTVHIVNSGNDKRRYVKKLGAATVAAIGNGHNDTPMLRVAGLGVVVVGREGVACDALVAATIATGSINDALDLLLYPQRLIATLRS